MTELSVVIPAYNEERRLPKTLDSVYQYLSGLGKEFEIVVVDDGSLDTTASVVEGYAATRPQIRLLSYSPNKGKGHAVRVGMLAARGELILFDDADGSSPIHEERLLTDAIAGGYDLAIASRAKPDDNRTVKALPYRKYIGNAFNMIVQCLLLPGLYDTQCGFKIFKREVAHDLFSVAHLNGFAFDVEVLFIARLRGYKVSEIPINWSNVEGSKVNVLLDSPKMLLEVLWIAAGAWFGRYRQLRSSLSSSAGSNGSSMRQSAERLDAGHTQFPTSQSGSNSDRD
jgi:dolichyl-phosphate beta-glucosyltransferase